MHLEVRRRWFIPTSTCGELRIDGVFECYILEPRKDHAYGKPFCIPIGTYDLVIEMSQHFGMMTPHLVEVPGFTFVEIHPGNFPSDTEACNLPGQSRMANVLDPKTRLKGYAVFQSRAAFAALMKKLVSPMTISYVEDPDSETKEN